MTIDTFLKLKDSFELQEYALQPEINKKECASFYGSPRKHPYEKERVVLVADPFSDHTFYYEFNLKDIVSVEEQPNLTSIEGKSVSMVRIWVKKKSIGLQSTPFIVGSIK